MIFFSQKKSNSYVIKKPSLKIFFAFLLHLKTTLALTLILNSPIQKDIKYINEKNVTFYF